MEGYKILDQINQQRAPNHRFIKYWRREHDFLTYELLDRFEEEMRRDDIKWLEGFELLDTEQMWQELKHRFPDRVFREKRTKGEFLVWKRPGKETRECFFTPESLIEVFDVETRGNVID